MWSSAPSHATPQSVHFLSRCSWAVVGAVEATTFERQLSTETCASLTRYPGAHIPYLLSSLVRTNLHPLRIQILDKSRKQNHRELCLVPEAGEQEELTVQASKELWYVQLSRAAYPTRFPGPGTHRTLFSGNIIRPPKSETPKLLLTKVMFCPFNFRRVSQIVSSSLLPPMGWCLPLPSSGKPRQWPARLHEPAIRPTQSMPSYDSRIPQRSKLPAGLPFRVWPPSQAFWSSHSKLISEHYFLSHFLFPLLLGSSYRLFFLVYIGQSLLIWSQGQWICHWLSPFIMKPTQWLFFSDCSLLKFLLFF